MSQEEVTLLNSSLSSFNLVSISPTASAALWASGVALLNISAKSQGLGQTIQP